MNSFKKQKEEKVLQYQIALFEERRISELRINTPSPTGKENDSKVSNLYVAKKSPVAMIKVKKSTQIADQGLGTKVSPKHSGEILQTIKKIGDGLQANVYTAKSSSTTLNENPSSCVKVFNIGESNDALILAKKEFEIGQLLKGHENIIQIDSFQEDQLIKVNDKEETHSFLKMELCKQGDLFDFVSSLNNSSKNKGLLWNELALMKSLFGQLIDSLSLLHNKAGYAHLDLKLENILISDDGVLKLCDFGFAEKIEKQCYQVLGTNAYMAPEVHNARATPFKGQAADIFSLGIIFFTIAFGAPPFHVANNTDLHFRYIQMKPGNHDFFKFHPNTRQQFRAGIISDDFKNLILSMLCADPIQRVQTVESLRDYQFLIQTQIPNAKSDQEYLCNMLAQQNKLNM